MKRLTKKTLWYDKATGEYYDSRSGRKRRVVRMTKYI